MRKWANLTFDTVSIVGWVLLGVLTIDATFNNSKMIIGLLTQ